MNSPSRRKSLTIFVIIYVLFITSAFGQIAQKPTASTGTDETSDNNAGSKRFLSSIATQSDFDLLARVYNAKTPYALPHVMFVIDREDKDKIYYVNSQMFRFHQDFANAQYLSLKRGEDFFKDVYTNDRRRLIVGTLAWQSPVEKFTFEFWEGDLVTPQMVNETYE